MRGFLRERMPQRIPSLEYKSFTSNCYLPRFTTTKSKSKVTDKKGRLYWDSMENVQHINYSLERKTIYEKPPQGICLNVTTYSVISAYLV